MSMQVVVRNRMGFIKCDDRIGVRILYNVLAHWLSSVVVAVASYCFTCTAHSFSLSFGLFDLICDM